MSVLSHALAICRNDIVPERWRQIKQWKSQDMRDSQWANEIHLATSHVTDGDPGELREDLVHLAALCVAWIEDLDRRQLARNVNNIFRSLPPAAADLPRESELVG